MNDDNSAFPNGGRWPRFDCHLHTRADREFSYGGEDNDYHLNYVEALEKAGIAVGVIANHNKFDFEEFNTLRKAAKKCQIFLLPGVELSVNDGANGIHTLIVFSEKWLEKGQDYISPLITAMFPGKSPDEYQNENGRGDKNILQVVEELDKAGRDYLLIFAHVEDRSGLWKEMGGGRLGDFATERYASVRRRTLGFQKVKTHDVTDRVCRVKVQKWLGDWYPAEVEGSDPKAIEAIGKGNPCYLKISHFSFEAIKYALLDHGNRVAAAKPGPHKHSHILSVAFDGGVLDKQTIRFSAELNTMIGIRGSGKSSILEAVRYALDIPFGEKALDIEYKDHLVDHVLGSGGKVTVRAVDQHGQQYEIRRINRERPDVYVDGVLQPGISLRETVIHKPLYFGQKDLSATGEGFEKDLVEKLVGEKLTGIRAEIDAQRQRVSELTGRWQKLSNTQEKKQEYEDKKRDAEFRLRFFKEHGVEEKLERQADFDTDARKCAQVVGFAQSYLAALQEFIDQHEDDLRNRRVYASRQNQGFFEEFFALYDELIATFERIKEILADGNRVLAELKGKTGEFTARKKTLKEEFAGIERALSEQLRQSGAEIIRPDEFRELKKTVEQADQMIEALDKQGLRRKSLHEEILKGIARLNELWHEEYKAIRAELEKVNERNTSLKIKAEFKGDKAAFVAFMKDVFRGSRIRTAILSSLAEAYPDFGAVYRAGTEAKEKIGLSDQTYQVFAEYFEKNLPALLTWQPRNRFTIEYRGKELKHHSLGQRASALILFVLGQRDNDLFIIDQPEDDLDNQTIYEDVIKLIRRIKSNTQFLFATHNANFPVLGDAEQIIACAYADDRVWVTGGSIDHPALQQRIVDIMEGGEEAFRQRRMRYESWKR
uniref:AAA domain n=1 Tax=Candidatus Kentrum eta TaxID=2126337 RepID=A0A450UQF0_9GAMM|nr:MAG: AAA domain [Candidatus Kentron sp. H]VFJ95604.1 MAG: AAA domain [Candidatus Kentron sp. H]VFK01852.1 MAG: AAA domain [Candidatus Kentron sp. H]